MTRMNQNNQKPLEFPKNRDALLRRAFEAKDGCVSVGGLAHRLDMLRAPATASSDTGKDEVFDTRRVALGKYVEFSRRFKGLSVEAFAAKANVDPAEVLQTEDIDAPAPEPRVIFALAAYLKADSTKLMELAGHLTQRDEKLGEEAIRFAAWSQGSKPLSKDEEKILAAFARVVVGATDRR